MSQELLVVKWGLKLPKKGKIDINKLKFWKQINKRKKKPWALLWNYFGSTNIGNYESHINDKIVNKYTFCQLDLTKQMSLTVSLS